jgi:hypothetical protein
LSGFRGAAATEWLSCRESHSLTRLSFPPKPTGKYCTWGRSP